MGGDPKITNQAPNFGGVNSKYEDVPFCKAAQTTARLVYSIDDEKLVPLPVTSPLPENTRDPKLGEVKYGLNLCQQYVSTIPQKYGLFVIIEDRLAHLRNVPAISSKRAQESIADSIVDPDLKECISTQLDSVTKLMAEMHQAYSPLEARALQQDSIYGAQNIVDHVIDDALDIYLEDLYGPIRLIVSFILKIFYLNKPEVKFLEKSLGFALQIGISKTQIYNIIRNALLSSDDMEQFTYKLITILCLRTAQRLHRNDEKKGGISEDFDTFVDFIVKNLNNGNITVGIMDLAELVETNNQAAAFYDPESNIIKLRPLNDNTSILKLTEEVVHECYHAYQDSGRKMLSMLHAEKEAYLRGQKASLLFQDHLIQQFDVSSLGDFFEVQQKIAFNPITLAAQQMQCLDYPDWMISKATFGLYDSMKSVMAYTMNLSAGVHRKRDGAKIVNDLFEDFYKGQSYSMYSSQFYLKSINDMANYLKSGDDAKKTLEENLGATQLYLDQVFASVKKEKPGSFKRGLAAMGYMNSFYQVLSAAYYVDKDLWQNLLRRSLKEKEFLAESLMSMPYTYNGLD